MPQMSPMWWLNMMLIFIFCMIIVNSMVYFNFMHNEFKSFKFKSCIYFWKW